LKLKFAIE